MIHIVTKVKKFKLLKIGKMFFQLFHLRNSYFFIYALFHKLSNVSSEHSFKAKDKFMNRYDFSQQ